MATMGRGRGKGRGREEGGREGGVATYMYVRRLGVKTTVLALTANVEAL